MPLVAAHLGKVVPTDDGAVALNTALHGRRRGDPCRGGRRRSSGRSISCSSQPATSRPRCSPARWSWSRRARASMLVESHEGAAGATTRSTPRSNWSVGDEAHVDHVKITGERRASALHVATLMAAIGAHARFNDFAFTTGGAVVRNQIFVRFDGEGTLAGIRGATPAQGQASTPTRRWWSITRPAAARAARCSRPCSTTKAAACSRARSSCGRTRRRPTPR